MPELEVTFEVEGNWVGKGRPRLAKGGHTYTPAGTKTYEEKVCIQYKRNCKAFFEKETPVAIDIIGLKSVPKNLSKDKDFLLGKPCLRTPDADNILKIVCDALNGVAYDDDKQVYDARITKYWDVENKIIVKLTGFEFKTNVHDALRRQGLK